MELTTKMADMSWPWGQGLRIRPFIWGREWKTLKTAGVEYQKCGALLDASYVALLVSVWSDLKRVIDRLTGHRGFWLIDWLTEWIIGRISWLVDWWINWLIDSFIDSFIDWLFYCLIGYFIYLLTEWFIDGISTTCFYSIVWLIRSS